MKGGAREWRLLRFLILGLVIFLIIVGLLVALGLLKLPETSPLEALARTFNIFERRLPPSV